MRLALLGDFHFSKMNHGTEEMKESRARAYQIMLQAFLEEQADLYVSIGDLTHEGLPEELEEIFSIIWESGRSFVHVLGNHDTYSIPKQDITAITGQARYQMLDTPYARLLFLDTTQEMNRNDWGGELDEEQQAWLSQQLQEAGGKQVLLFGHHPVFDTTSLSTLDKLYIRPRDMMRQVLNKKAGGGLYFCGHNHMNSIVQQGDWHYVQTAACLDVPAYRIIEIDADEVRITHQWIYEEGLMTDIRTFNRDMPGFGPSEDALGEARDLTLIVQQASVTR